MSIKYTSITSNISKFQDGLNYIEEKGQVITAFPNCLPNGVTVI